MSETPNEPAGAVAGEEAAAPASAPGSDSEDGAGSAAAAPVDWRAALPEDLRGAPALKDIQDVSALTKQFLDTQALVGSSIRIPSEHASAEDLAAFQTRLQERVPGLVHVAPDDPESFAHTMRSLGAPEAADGYALPEMEGAEGLRQVEGFQEWAHEANLTQRQFATLAEKFTAASQARAEQGAVQHNADLEALSREWGQAYDGKVANAAQLVRLKGGPEEFAAAIEAGKVQPAILKFMGDLADGYGEADLGEARKQGGDRAMTPAEATAQLDEIMRNREHPYWDKGPTNPEKQRAMEQVLKLRELSMGVEGRAPAAVIGQQEDF